MARAACMARLTVCRILLLATLGHCDPFNRSHWQTGLLKLIEKGVEVSDEPMTIIGKLPPWLSGSLYRNGPGAFTNERGDQKVNGAFDGYAAVQKFDLSAGTHSMRFLQSSRYKQLQKRGDMSYQGKIMMGTTPPRKENHLDVMNMGGEVSVNFVDMKDAKGHHLLALGELPFGLELNASTLETIDGADHSYFKFNDSIADTGMGCAHPIKLPNGDLISKIALIPTSKFGGRTDYTIFRIPAGTSRRETLATFSKWEMGITYAHAFPIASARYAILPFWPLKMSKASTLIANNMIDGMHYRPQDGTHLTVVDLVTGAATTYRANETFYGFHFSNAFVTKDADGNDHEIVADVVLTSSNAFSSLMLDAFRNGSAIDHMVMSGPLRRIRIPLSTSWTRGEGTSCLGDCNEQNMQMPERLASAVATLEYLPGEGSRVLLEAPRINDAWLMSPNYRYVYGWHPTRADNYPNAVVKLDVHTGAFSRWVDPKDEFDAMMGEAIFVPAPARLDAMQRREETTQTTQAEDDGVVISSGLQISTGRAFVLILNATTFQEMARVYARTHVTFGFHSQFYPKFDV